MQTCPSSSEIRLELDHVSPSDQVSEKPCYVRPGDSLTGNVFVSIKLPLYNSWVEVSLEGLESVPPLDDDEMAQPSHPQKPIKVDRVEYLQFLYVVAHSKILPEHAEAGSQGQTFAVPFKLVIPAGVDRTNDRVVDRCKPLLPSFRISRPSCSAWNPIIPPAVFVAYIVRASVTHSAPESAASGTRKVFQVGQSIELLPYVEPPPPIETRYFPDLYILSARQHTRTYIFGRKLGHMTITALEPRPLVYESSELPSTKCEFRITVEGSLSDLQRFRTASVKLQLMLHINTHYSSTRIDGIPRGGIPTEKGPVRMYQDAVFLTKHTASNLRWTRDFNEQDSPQALDVEALNEPDAPPVQAGDPKAAADNEARAAWHATISVPIKSPCKLLPNFLGNFVALSYSISTRASLAGVYMPPVFLSTPLQVAYPFHSHHAMDDADTELSGSPPPWRDNDNACCSAIAGGIGVDNKQHPPPYDEL
ncbi:hypothetical protein S40288_02348 [Stachybotrys chartarum IBT 40288]|nr:hypothetical protein S40288_02348 [Stachybotrys chartarum IBT 40288]